MIATQQQLQQLCCVHPVAQISYVLTMHVQFAMQCALLMLYICIAVPVQMQDSRCINSVAPLRRLLHFTIQDVVLTLLSLVIPVYYTRCIALGNVLFQAIYCKTSALACGFAGVVNP